ncbi:hypothetical protein L0F63_001693 [Massospora cicadina]|nr:hypothetical protein L0F63_001693 [Massospora cicadina]
MYSPFNCSCDGGYFCHLGQDFSRAEPRPNPRKVLPALVAAPSNEIKSDKEAKPTPGQSLDPSRSRENSLSLLMASPTLPSPLSSRLHELFGGAPGSKEDSVKPVPPSSLHASEAPSRLPALSTSVPSESLIVDHFGRRTSFPHRNNLSAPLSWPYGMNSLKGVVTVVEYSNPTFDPVLVKLKRLPKYPFSFSNPPGLAQSTAQPHSSGLSTATFPFPGLWSRPSPKPKLQVLISETFDERLRQLASAYQAHARTACRLLLKNQLKLVTEVKDAESSCAHVATYTAPHLNHLKESHAQFATTLEDLRDEVANARLLLKGIFKSVEKINSFFSKGERIGYLKYQAQEQYPNLHQAYRRAMLKGSPPQFNTRSAGSGMLGRRRRESAVVLTLDNVLSERHRPYSTTYTSISPCDVVIEPIARPLSSTSRASLDGFGTSASQRLYDIAISRPPTSVGCRTYTNPRTASPSIRHFTSTPAERLSGSPIRAPRDLESLLLFPSKPTSQVPTCAALPSSESGSKRPLRIDTNVARAKDR